MNRSGSIVILLLILLGVLLVGGIFWYIKQTPPINTTPLSKEQTLAASSFSLSAEVVADPDHNTLYVAAPSNTINAIDMSSGKILWSMQEDAKPLALINHHLVAKVEPQYGDTALKMVVLDVDHAGAPLVNAEIPFDAINSIDAIDSRIDKGRLIILWHSVSCVDNCSNGGIAPPGPAKYNKEAGAAAIDIDTGRVEILKNYPNATGEQITIPPNIEQWVQSEQKTSGNFVHWSPLPTKNVITAVERTSGDSTNGFIVKRWKRNGELLPDVKLAQERSTNVAFAEEDEQFILSPDERFLLLSRGDGDDGRGRFTYQWTIYSLDTSGQIVEMRHQVDSRPPFLIKGSVLIYETGGYEVHGIDLASHSLIWKQPIRDTRRYSPVYP